MIVGVRRSIWVGLSGATVLALIFVATPYVRAARMLSIVTDRPSASPGWWRAGAAPVTKTDLEIVTRHGHVQARLYRPAGTPAFRLIVFPGVHAGGVDEPRLVALSTRLAAAGALVVSVPVPDLRNYRVTARATDVIEDATRWMADTPALAPSGRVGLVGVSFAGGLALVAAGRPALDDRLTSVVSIGGHGDLPRVMAYLCSGELADGRPRPPHDYGLAVLLLEAAPEIVPADELDGFTAALRLFLDASSTAGTDAAGAMVRLEEARAKTETLPVASQAIMREVLARDVRALGRRLLPLIGRLGQSPALSPARSPATRAPVFLLHGADDPVIPETEAGALARDLQARGGGPVSVLVTPLLAHADLSPAVAPADAWALVRFWSGWIARAQRAP